MLGSRLLSGLLVACLVAIPLAPAQHVHETEEHGHHELLVHSHSEAHHAHALTGEHFRLSLDDENSVVLTIDPVLAPPHHAVTLVAPSAIAVAIIEPPAYLPAPAAPYVERLIHGPPRAPAVLRGPPSLSLL